MTPAEFERRWKHDVAHAEKTLVKDGFLAPLFIVVDRDGQIHIVPASFSDEETKRFFIDLVRMTAIAVDADAVIARMESWAVLGDPPPEGVSPSQSDRRVEVVAVFMCAHVGKRTMRRASIREIIRNDDGNAVGVWNINLPENDSDQSAGTMFDLLPPIRPTLEQRAVAAAVVEEMRRRGPPVRA